MISKVMALNGMFISIIKTSMQTIVSELMDINGYIIVVRDFRISQKYANVIGCKLKIHVLGINARWYVLHIHRLSGNGYPVIVQSVTCTEVSQENVSNASCTM